MTFDQTEILAKIKEKNLLIQKANNLRHQSNKFFEEAGRVELEIAKQLARDGENWTINAQSAMSCFDLAASELSRAVLSSIYDVEKKRENKNA